MPRMSVSRVVDAPIDEVWEYARPFDSIEDWHLGVSKCTIEDDQPADRVGIIRNAVTEDGTFRERLVAFSDLDHTWAYRILDGPIPVEDYVGRFQLTPITDGNRTRSEWSTTFDIDFEHRDRVVRDLTEGLNGALKGLSQHFEG